MPQSTSFSNLDEAGLSGLNFVERGMVERMAPEPWLAGQDSARLVLFEMVTRYPGDKDTTVELLRFHFGFALLVANVIAGFRVQDHLRRMGLAMASSPTPWATRPRRPCPPATRGSCAGCTTPSWPSGNRNNGTARRAVSRAGRRGTGRTSRRLFQQAQLSRHGLFMISSLPRRREPRKASGFPPARE